MRTVYNDVFEDGGDNEDDKGDQWSRTKAGRVTRLILVLYRCRKFWR